VIDHLESTLADEDQDLQNEDTAFLDNCITGLKKAGACRQSNALSSSTQTAVYIRRRNVRLAEVQTRCPNQTAVFLNCD
jgi:hypothetical protein